MQDMGMLAAVQRMQALIEENLTEPLTLVSLAKAAGYSPWHASRLFKEATGKTPFEYIRARRLSQAALALQSESRPRVLDVALDFEFDSHEGFSRAFSRQFGVNPKRYAADPGPLPLFLPEPVLQAYLALHPEDRKEKPMFKGTTVFTQVVERPARKLLLKRGKTAEDYFAYCEEVGCDVWGVLCSVKEALYEPVGLWLPEKLIAPGTSKYVQGVELPAEYSGKVPEGYEIIDLDPCTLMVFQGEPFEEEDYGEAIGQLWAHIEAYNPVTYGYEWAEDEAPRFQLAPMGYRGYIEARPIRRL